MNNKDIKKTIKRFIAGFFLVAIALLIFEWKYTHTFFRHRWLKYPDKRLYMIDNLTERYPIEGSSKEEIVQLLGDDEYPDNEKVDMKISWKPFDTNKTLIYYLGVRLIDDVYLVITFDENDIADSYTLDIT